MTFQLQSCAENEWDLILPNCQHNIAFTTWIPLEDSEEYTHTFNLSQHRNIVILPYLPPPYSIDIELLRTKADLIITSMPGDTLFQIIGILISYSNESLEKLRRILLSEGCLSMWEFSISSSVDDSEIAEIDDLAF